MTTQGSATESATEDISPAVQFAVILQIMEDKLANPDRYLVGIEEMVEQFRMGLTADAIDILDSDEVNDLVDDVIGGPEFGAQDFLQELLGQIGALIMNEFTEADEAPIDLYPSFAEGFGEGREVASDGPFGFLISI